jgi:hypothetical protein
MIEMKKNIEVKCRSKIQERAQVFAKDAYFSVGFVQKLNMGRGDKRHKAENTPQRRNQWRCEYLAENTTNNEK